MLTEAERSAQQGIQDATYQEAYDQAVKDYRYQVAVLRVQSETIARIAQLYTASISAEAVVPQVDRDSSIKRMLRSAAKMAANIERAHRTPKPTPGV